MLENKQSKLIVFDLDGTLVDSESVYFEVLGDLLAPYKLGSPEKVLEKTRSQPPEKLFDEVLGVEEGQVVLNKLREIDKELYKKVKVFPGIVELLENLFNRGTSLALWTARDRKSATMVIENLKLDRFFPFWVSGSCIDTNKPSSQGLKKVISHYGMNGNEVVMVGDHDHDLIPAQSMGALPVHAQWKTKPSPNSAGIECLSFTKVSEFSNWIFQEPALLRV